MGGHALAMVRVGMAMRRHETGVVTPVRLPPIQMLNHTQFQWGLGGNGN